MALGMALGAERWRYRALLAFLEDTHDVPFSDGKIFFDEHDNFMMANRRAHSLLPCLQAGATAPCTLGGFLDYMFDNAIDAGETVMAGAIFPARGARSNDVAGFREIILSTENRLCLAEVLKTGQDRTVIVLSDAGHFRRI
jgi:hypothetical protein